MDIYLRFVGMMREVYRSTMWAGRAEAKKIAVKPEGLPRIMPFGQENRERQPGGSVMDYTLLNRLCHPLFGGYRMPFFTYTMPAAHKLGLPL
jgi:hypothetical protein